MNKGLKAVKDIRDICSGMTTVFDEDLNIIEKELKEKEELQKLLEHERELNNHLILHELKALEIIKEKDVSMYWFRHSKSYEEYNNFILTDKRQYQKLTQEEYELIKEVLM